MRDLSIDNNTAQIMFVSLGSGGNKMSKKLLCRWITLLFLMNSSIVLADDDRGWSMVTLVELGESSGFGENHENTITAELFGFAVGFDSLYGLGVGTKLAEFKGDLFSQFPIYFYLPLYSEEKAANFGHLLWSTQTVKSPIIYMFLGGSNWAELNQNKKHYGAEYINIGLGVEWTAKLWNLPHPYSIKIEIGMMSIDQYSDSDDGSLINSTDEPYGSIAFSASIV